VVALLRGLIARYQAPSEVRPSFESALREAEALIAQTPGLYDAWDTKALALWGLGDAAAAESAYQQARALNSDAGVVARVERLKRQLGIRN